MSYGPDYSGKFRRIMTENVADVIPSLVCNTY